jgi:polysaccharide export outer membrane protein
MRFWFRIPALIVCAVCLGTAQKPATPTPAETEGQRQNRPVEAPPLTPPATQSPANTNAAPAPAKDSSLEPPPPKRQNAGTAPMPKPAVTDGPDGKPYVIGPLDVLYIRVWNNSNLTGMVDVRTDGMISLALVGEVKADGLTVPQLTELLNNRFSEYMLNPEVNVQVTKVNSKKYLIFGGVGRPGEYPLIGKMTIFEALVTAGLRDTAKQTKIVLMRGSEKHPFNYKEVLKGQNMKQDIPLENGDRIYVPE